jgi:phenylacetic acid degradation operon negative regulatory protein
MKRQTEEFLNLCLWSAEMLLRPTFLNLTESYEGWAYRNGLLPRLSLLEHKRLLERNPAEPHDRLYRLTAEGRLHALGGRDPQERWSRTWDGRWLLVLFDVPVTHNHDRKRLRRYLIQRGFGYLQNSVWITPDALDQEMKILVGGKINVESLIFMEARPCAGESDEAIVAGAWDFERINGLYSRLLEVLNQCADVTGRNASAKALLRWLALERETWIAAISSDPLLPETLLPADYLGKIAWSRRKEVLREASRRWRNFKFSDHGAGQM